MMVVVTFVSLMRARLHHRLHARRSGLQAVLQLHLAVHVLDADARDVEQLACSCSSAGRRWAWSRYLLIGFWYTRPTAIFANMKAFLVNRVGDFGFLLGIAGIVYLTGSLHYCGRLRAGRTQIAGSTFELLPGHAWQAR